MKKIGLISCSPNEHSLSAKGLIHAQALINNHDNISYSLFSWRKLWGNGEEINKELRQQYSHELALCNGYIWAFPIHCGSPSYHASQFLEQFSGNMLSKFHGLIISAGSPYFYLAHRDLAFQLMIETNGIVLPRPALICESDYIDNSLSLSTVNKIEDIITKLNQLISAII